MYKCDVKREIKSNDESTDYKRTRLETKDPHELHQSEQNEVERRVLRSQSGAVKPNHEGRSAARFSCFLCRAITYSVRLSPDISPILLSNIIVDLYGCVAGVQCVATAALGSGNPVVIATIDVVIIGFEALSFETLKFLTSIVQRAASL